MLCDREMGSPTGGLTDRQKRMRWKILVDIYVMYIWISELDYMDLFAHIL